MSTEERGFHLPFPLKRLLPLSLLLLVSCGGGEQQGVPVQEQSKGSSSVEVGAPAGNDLGNDPDPAPVIQQTDAPTGDDDEKTPAADDDEEPVPDSGGNNLPALDLLEDPDFQRRAKLGHLVAKRRCILCHKVDGRGAILQPPLIQVSVRRLLRMKEFPAHLVELKDADPDRYKAHQQRFDRIEAEPDLLRKMSIWLHGYLKQPTFDNPEAKMPLQVLKPEEIDQLSSYVIQLAVDGVKKGIIPPE